MSQLLQILELGDGSSSPDRELEEVQQLLDGGGMFGDEGSASPTAVQGPIVLTAEPDNFSVPALNVPKSKFKGFQRKPKKCE